ncbi:MAG: class I SAM-dependent methyltransferase [Microcoleus sp. PH2017_10_PVI_O_A]|uniref:class I SAM-dependent methyltransferase n=1 Tax=unclassified Microcoleus TaxID=2642155 RepID=UPI001D4B8A44|nr:MULTISPECIES: class I SAM-dependent methyltransferase [unclassified Microcoleus]MCC3404116.1 class I SAM-dependent methyltransferase [Microcoleus sp. PH2017_10_PVI_O_A]MCC3458200.1 class I SAM-dependent methyltransferase [Microcoleus sp. PH2017_11_PCY_U_A]MCC3476622.1 class I SAM-dependent methyltransferase [Microcoleus sp. PH2017_12_PCY_D_A]MCC3557553.1 class I SAM-dependent methyltransferase [Microcoleus sp. PH2017_27_LUM_O_A]
MIGLALPPIPQICLSYLIFIPYLVSPLLEMLATLQDASPTKLRVLDLGCGNGSLSHVIAEHGCEVVGVDTSAPGIAISRQSFPECQFIQADIYELPDTDMLNSFDVVLALEVIEHLLYPKELAKNAKLCLKPGGVLIIYTPYHGYLKNLILAVLGKLDKHFAVLWDNGHIKIFSLNTLTQLLTAEGYTDIDFKFAGRCPYLWKSMLCSSKFTEKSKNL